jgi:hypothetical protein
MIPIRVTRIVGNALNYNYDNYYIFSIKLSRIFVVFIYGIYYCLKESSKSKR